MKLEAFLYEESIMPANEHHIISHRFKEDEKSLTWEFKALTAKEEESIRKESITGHPAVFDTQKYWGKLAASSILSPNLMDATLQDSYGVMTPEDLLKTMLMPGEYKKLIEIVQKINGFDESIKEKKDKAKN